MSKNSGALSIDFLVGFTIFVLAFIWVLSIIPGLLIGLQAFTVDYDAVAYRTGVILVEDPGAPSEPTAWEVAVNKADVKRFGLAVSGNDPGVLSPDKINRFFDTSTFTYPYDYRNLSIFGDYPYSFNISFRQIGSNGNNKSVGAVLPEGYGYIRRFVKIKTLSNATIEGDAPFTQSYYVNGDNETTHQFSILIDNANLTGKTSLVKDPAYQIIPSRESFWINFTNLKSTIWPDRTNCFDLKILEPSYKNGLPGIPIEIDGVPISLTDHNWPKSVVNNVSVHYIPNVSGVDFGAPQINLYLTFNLVNNGGCPFVGSRFLNSTFAGKDDHTFNYDYNVSNVTQPQLKDAMLEVAVW